MEALRMSALTRDDLLDQLRDRVEIAALNFRYCRYADAEGMLSLFTDDCIVHFDADEGAVMRGRDELATFYHAALTPVASSSHHVSNSTSSSRAATGRACTRTSTPGSACRDFPR
jgi:SnoaL-like domain